MTSGIQEKGGNNMISKRITSNCRTVACLFSCFLIFIPICAASLSSTPDIIVNTTSDVADFGGPQQVDDLPGPDGVVSLREAITAAENTPGPQVIGFNIRTNDPGFDGMVFTIVPLSELPPLLVGGTTIDGTTQTASTGNTNLSGPEIVVTGGSAGDEPAGLFVSSSFNVIRGLVINDFQDGVIITGPGALSNRIEGCFIGTNAAGTAAQGNTKFGVFVAGGASNNVIGGTLPGAGNLVSGNHNIPFGAGVYIHQMLGQHTDGNRVEGNLIGTDITGTMPIPNGKAGVDNPGTTNTLIKSNIIAFNGHVGVSVGTTLEGDVPKGVTISRNSIFLNAGLGIDLGPHGTDNVTPNDPGDTDTGPNNLMNFPVLTSAKATPGQLIVKGTIDTPNPKTVTIEFFANPVPTPGGDPSGHGEGAIFLGTKKPDAQGKFTATLPPVPPGTLITATATDADGNTSEFAENIEAERPGK